MLFLAMNYKQMYILSWKSCWHKTGKGYKSDLIRRIWWHIYSGKISVVCLKLCYEGCCWGYPCCVYQCCMFKTICYEGCCWGYPCGGVCEGPAGADYWWKGGLLPTVWWYSAFIHGEESPEFAHIQRIWFYSSSWWVRKLFIFNQNIMFWMF